MKLPKLTREDLIEVSWVDICEDSVGSPDKATLARRVSVGYFFESRKDGKIQVLITSGTQDQDDHEQRGYCIYPLSVVTSVKKIRKARKATHAKRP